ncbi:MAG TPA: tetratricopeptide repeat protein, partial [Bacteroidales bacterium]|nr:tetratricopeptide repeat protein [Bacteroidales bacterium]
MESSFEHNETDLKALLERFEEMVRSDGAYFFDVEDLEDIVDYYLDNQNLVKAKKAIDLAEAQHPGSTVFQLKKARYLILSEKTGKAISLLEEIEKIDPTNPDIYMLKGSILSRLKKYDEAIGEYHRALFYSGDSEDIYNSIAFEYENAGNYDKAAEYLVRILEINPDNEAVIFELSFCYEITDNLEGAVDFLTQFLDRYPYNKIAWFNLGIAYNNLELFERAIEA